MFPRKDKQPTEFRKHTPFSTLDIKSHLSLCQPFNTGHNQIARFPRDLHDEQHTTSHFIATTNLSASASVEKRKRKTWRSKEKLWKQRDEQGWCSYAMRKRKLTFVKMYTPPAEKRDGGGRSLPKYVRLWCMEVIRVQQGQEDGRGWESDRSACQTSKQEENIKKLSWGQLIITINKLFSILVTVVQLNFKFNVHCWLQCFHCFPSHYCFRPTWKQNLSLTQAPKHGFWMSFTRVFPKQTRAFPQTHSTETRGTLHHWFSNNRHQRIPPCKMFPPLKMITTLLQISSRSLLLSHLWSDSVCERSHEISKNFQNNLEKLVNSNQFTGKTNPWKCIFFTTSAKLGDHSRWTPLLSSFCWFSINLHIWIF